MVLVDYIGFFFYMRQYFWPHTVYRVPIFVSVSTIFQLEFGMILTV